MLAVVDIETRGLDAREFVTACLIKENGSKEHFYSKEDLWFRILELGEKEAKRKRILNLYAHNHEYDFYGYADLTDDNLEFFSFRPFIASYLIDGKKAINFLDSMAIFKMPLKKLGDMIGMPKMDLPDEFANAQRITKKRIKELEPYVERDVEIVLKAILMMKEKMANEGIQLKRLYTISQIAISYLMNILRKDDRYKGLFFDRRRGKFLQTRFKDKIHNAYRGGRVECFNLGEFSNVDYIDVNNLYGFASMNIKFPDLSTERFIFNPLKYTNIKDLLGKIGISRVLIHNKSNEIGLLPIRTDIGNYYPKEDTKLLGTYTHIELQEALKEGYEILAVEWSILWDEMDNPFKEITTKLYNLRTCLDNDFDKFFYKEMQNRSYGKMAQRKSGQEIIIDNVEMAKAYLQRNFEVIQDDGYNYFYKRDRQEHFKSYYAPIIPTLINAWSRVYMYKMFKYIPKEDLIYTDTDSIIMKKGHLHKFPISSRIGDFKVECQDEVCIIRGRKTYAIGEEVKVAGFRKANNTLDDFRKGTIKSKRMITLNTAKDLSQVGGFVDEIRDLKEQEDVNRTIQSLYKKEKVFKDKDLSNISFFSDIL